MSNRWQTMILAILGGVTMTVLPVGAVPSALASAQSKQCQISAFGQTVSIECSSKWVNADWNKDGTVDEVVYVDPDYQVYRFARGVRPVAVSGGRALTMSGSETRASGAHRIYARTTNYLYWCQYGSGGWGGWYRYVP